MKTNMTFIVAVGFAIFSCNKGRDSSSNDEISGSYAREFSFKVVNHETGIEIGLRTIRDTIFIKKREQGYEVSNNKWRLNNYDKEGWQNMAHSDNRPIQTFIANFGRDGNSLSAESGQALFLDLKNNRLYSDKWRQNNYNKIK